VEAEAKTTVRTRALCITTRCKSLDELIARFHRFVDEDSFFIATKDVRPVGLETAFSIQLADKTPVLRGTCVVLQVWSTDANPFRLPGLRIGVKNLTASSIAVFEQLLVTRKPVRTPGSEIVLPANPLAEMSDVSLEGFVECALTEDETIEPPSVVVDEAQLSQPNLAPQLAMPEPEPEPQPAPPPIAPEPPAIEPPRWDSTPLLAGSSTVPPEPRRRRRVHIAIAGAALAVAAIAIAVPFAFATGDDEPPVRAAAATPTLPAIEAPVPVAPEPPAAEPPCKSAVASTPAGANVLLDGQPAGATPLELPATCERHKLDIAHVRYQPTTRWVTPAAGQPSTVELQLARPKHQLQITTTPPGATIVIDGERAGTTPAVIDVQGFTVLKLAFVRKGFHTTTARYYSKVPRDRLSVQMAK